MQVAADRCARETYQPNCIASFNPLTGLDVDLKKVSVQGVQPFWGALRRATSKGAQVVLDDH